jgi:hypothetical protein
MHSDLLRATGAEGPVARAVVRMLAREGVTADVVAILEFFAHSPESLIEAANRQGGGRDDRKAQPGELHAPIRPDQLQPIDASQTPSTWTGDGGSIAFGNLLVPRIAEARYARWLVFRQEGSARVDSRFSASGY